MFLGKFYFAQNSLPLEWAMPANIGAALAMVS
jgi:hypothetical protein